MHRRLLTAASILVVLALPFGVLAGCVPDKASSSTENSTVTLQSLQADLSALETKVATLTEQVANMLATIASLEAQIGEGT